MSGGTEPGTFHPARAARADNYQIRLPGFGLAENHEFGVAGNHIGGDAAELKLARPQPLRRMLDHGVRIIARRLFEPDIKVIRGSGDFRSQRHRWFNDEEQLYFAAFRPRAIGY